MYKLVAFAHLRTMNIKLFELPPIEDIDPDDLDFNNPIDEIRRNMTILNSWIQALYDELDEDGQIRVRAAAEKHISALSLKPADDPTTDH